MTTVREMAITELIRIAEIDRSEHITEQYKSRKGVLELIDVDIRARRWGEPGARPLQEYVDAWRPLVERGGVLLGAFDAVYAVLGPDPGEREVDAGVEELIAEREAARRDRDWARADALRDRLAERGILLEDTPAGPRWKRSAGT